MNEPVLRSMKKTRSVRGIWQVGFHLDSLTMLGWLSGLIEIHDILWTESKDAIVFTVKSLDKTGKLFNQSGGLVARQVDNPTYSGQPLFVERPQRGDMIEKGEN